MNKVMLRLMLTALIMNIFCISFIVSTEAQGFIYIRPDGTVKPSTAPIKRVGNYYTFTNNIYEPIVVEKDDITIDGDGYLLQDNWVPGSTSRTAGITLMNRKNVNIRNITIKAFYWGIYLNNSCYNTIVENNVMENYYGIFLNWYCSYNTIVENNVIYNGRDGIDVMDFSNNNVLIRNDVLYNDRDGVSLHLNSYNRIVANNAVLNNRDGIAFRMSSKDTIIENNVTRNNQNGTYLFQSNGSRFYHNNFIGNTRHVYDESWANSTYTPSINVWDDDYPSGGNHWDNHTAPDSNGDGIVDIPYIIDNYNRDRYPLVKPWIVVIFESPIEVKENFTATKDMTFKDNAFNVTENNSSINLNGYGIFGSGKGYGVVVEGVNGVTIRNGTIMFFETGISLRGSNNTIITQNDIKANKRSGIMLYLSSNNRIFGNNITTNSFNGIELYGYSSYNSIYGNSITNNYYGIGLWSYSSYNSIYGNSITNNYYGIVLDYCSNNSIYQNNIAANDGEGIVLNLSSNNRIFGNNITNRLVGIEVKAYSSNNSIFGNNITEHYWDGIAFRESSKNNNVYRNNIINNGVGILFSESSNNSVYHNNFVNNTDQIYDVSWDNWDFELSINVFDDAYPSGGNYWSDYRPTVLCYDDGYAETQFEFTGTGGIAAVRFSPPMNGIITNCRFYARDILYNPYNWDEPLVEVHVLDANMEDMITPFLVEIGAETWYEVNLSRYEIRVSTDFYIGIELTDTQRLRLFADTSSPDGRSWYYLNGAWIQWTEGDYLIRVTVGAGMDANGDGIGDTPYVIDINNQDRYPLMQPRITALLTDLNMDGRVNIQDITMVAVAFGSRPEDPNWNFLADLDNNQAINIIDIARVAMDFGITY